MKPIIFVFTVFFALGLTSAAFAGQACYSKAEAEAEQGLRIHSELMVIGLNCQAMPRFASQNLYGKYRIFTRDHADLIAAYEKILTTYFQRTGSPDPAGSFNTLRTTLANKVSRDAASMRPDLFCVRYAPRIEQASGMDMKAVRKWASTFYPSHPVSSPICDQ